MLQGAFSRDIVVGAKEVVEEIVLEEEGGRKIRGGKSFCWIILRKTGEKLRGTTERGGDILSVF